MTEDFSWQNLERATYSMWRAQPPSQAGGMLANDISRLFVGDARLYKWEVVPREPPVPEHMRVAEWL